MPTPSEQKALAFVAIVILLGGAVRVLRAGPTTSPTPSEQQGLAAQAASADSAARGGKQPKSRSRRRSSRSSSPDTMPRVVGGVASVPPTYARPDQPFGRVPYGYDRALRAAAVPSPRIDTDARGVQSGPPPASTSSAKKNPPGIIDLDRASAAEIEMLPRIGPATARRIVANRDSMGPFGSLEGLRRVKGMGPASLTRLAPFISFGGRPAGGPKP